MSASSGRVVGTRSVLAASVVVTAALAAAPAARALVIAPTFSNTSNTQNATWTAQEKATVQAAINNWTSKITDNQTVNVTFDFTDAGSTYLAEWEGGGSYFVGDNLNPWTSTLTQTIHLNADYLATDFFGTGASGESVPQTLTDALSVFRHEIGHMMGFAEGFYYSSAGNSATDKWTSHIVVNGANHTAYFDPSGLDVQMASDTNLSHVYDVSTGQTIGGFTYPQGGGPGGDVMSPGIAPGVRRDISNADLQMLSQAYGYKLAAVPEPAAMTALLVAGCGAVLGRRRRRGA